MARYSILGRFLVVPNPLTIGEADTPAEAVKMARAFAAKGKQDIQIGDNQAQIYYPAEEFAAKHGIR
jgi:hypothetical protein